MSLGFDMKQFPAQKREKKCSFCFCVKNCLIIMELSQHVKIINFVINYEAKTVAPNSKKKSRNRRKNNKRKDQ